MAVLKADTGIGVRVVAAARVYSSSSSSGSGRGSCGSIGRVHMDYPNQQ